MTGKPNLGDGRPTGVVCNFANFAAREGAFDWVDDERDNSRKSVTRKYFDGPEASSP